MEKDFAMGRGPNKAAARGGFGKSSPNAGAGGGNEADHRGEYIASSSPFQVFNSAGREEMVAAAFTGAQWKELERQAMIYKYMISSLPVPPNLLGAPVEAGRCKRTDGKKWRCSRDVAPQQKYCERHLNRGRPRSRKPVEVNNKTGDEKQKKPRGLQQTPSKDEPPLSLSLFNFKSDDSSHRDSVEQKWLESDVGFANSICGTALSVSHQDMNHVVAYSDFPRLDIDDNMGPTLPLMGYESLCGLEFDNGGVGLYVEESSWWSSPVCWGAFGGPLAEALCANPPGDSSPVSGVTMYSNSGESSVCTSPSEIGFQRIM